MLVSYACLYSTSSRCVPTRECCDMHVSDAYHMHEAGTEPGSGPVMYGEQHI